MGSCVGAEEARERIGAALAAIGAAHDTLRETSSDVVGNDFRVEVAERLETQEQVNRGLMYRFFGEIAEPPDGTESIPSVRGMLCARLRITPQEIVRRFKLVARIRPRRSLTGPPVGPELAELAAAVEAGAVGEDHIRAVCHAVDVLPACVSPVEVAKAERTLVRHATKLDAGVVTKLGSTIADCLVPGYRCEVHHSPDWADGGRTDADKLHFACDCDHDDASNGHWRTTVTDNGRLGWTDGTGSPQINHAHHPEELLRGDPDPPDEDQG